MTDPGRVRRLAARLVRYAAVSLVSTAVTMTLLGLLVYFDRLTPGWDNVIATSAGMIPSFELNRRWVWGKAGRRSVWRELVPYFAWSFLELGLSTFSVSHAAAWAGAAGLGAGATTLISQAANLATFGVLWILQYVILDRVLFATSQTRTPGNRWQPSPSHP